MKVRHSRYAGVFYASEPSSLRTQIESCFNHELGPGELPSVKERPLQNLVALICPHAGYIYSGPIAAHSYHALAMDGKPDIVLILGPNHTGRGSGLAIMNEGTWLTPLGGIGIDPQTANEIMDELGVLDLDDSAHAQEHSIEVQLPFLQNLFGSAFKFVPICFLMQDFESCYELGEAVAKALSGKNAIVIASTDMNHYESQETGSRKDKLAIDAILRLDEEEFYSTVESYGISACGYGPVVSTITAAKNLGAKRARLLCYKTSGDVTGSFYSVVGYASVSFTK